MAWFYFITLTYNFYSLSRRNKIAIIGLAKLKALLLRGIDSVVLVDITCFINFRSLFTYADIFYSLDYVLSNLIKFLGTFGHKVP